MTKKQKPDISRIGFFVSTPRIFQRDRRRTLFDFKPMVDFMKECITKHGLLATVLTFVILSLFVTMLILAWKLPEILTALTPLLKA